MEIAHITDSLDATIITNNGISEESRIKGTYHFKCFDPEGNLKWEEPVDNLITDVGARAILDAALGGTAISGFFLGLISSVGWGSVNNAHTMASHATWTEAGDATNLPTWSTPASNARVAVTWSAASGRTKALSATANFTIATGGTVQGAFLVMGAGAVATHDDTNGTLYSCGAFGSPKIVGAADTLQVTYSTTV